ncbi:MAG: deoxyribodipyrimidine photolyase [Flavobacteriaceae bacterium CG2_30_34_30]|nr:deoxyribodipyrimidine photo-lyase [Flavobacteriia bacterium]OIP52480.1 MAG: deoxyribodipyrimidine photolyase [Flavobacteriaceae bacterium CG2_30_34_30]PIQ17947.1 MAG: deoxyribodipyrimidine photolyase [Flavobacteriaceae bacterium CG18_big_fil_WC_8_21_14_2_50_34_36]PIV51606.1 MAG: deoxyribodipyrimidine photolyase [Flavobacteriaceae bacterium CG02_land_8_20_14_3_00_34_13]PIZ07221.1 MAG: deoxyribodipyrimidine photolyase [Flavobacteriaceae bacterium CG_4_10_14_0_8_um_filter_34_31]PJC07925.1 MAG:
MYKEKVNIFWFRRDLRLEDNLGFCKALQGKFPVLPLFIFDPEILETLPKDDARVSFIYIKLQALSNHLKDTCKSSIAMYYGNPLDVFEKIVHKFDVQNVITNRDYEPYALVRDKNIENFLSHKKISFYTFKDQVIFEKDEIIKEDGTPYLVFTPYMKKWKEQFKKQTLRIYSCKPYLNNCLTKIALPNVTLEDIGFTLSKIDVPEYNLSKQLIHEYENTRNLPAIKGTSYLGTHLRFGTIGIRQVVENVLAEKNETFLNELIWREFFMQILYHFPETQTLSFKKKYDHIVWRNNEADFEKWKTGTTGYPLVDAGMRQLNETGWMHNRVRMLVGSFLCKHLLIDWRWGEAYFAEKLLDYEMASNIGNWQWIAGCGVDAAPYFRIFNPTTQIEKFDKNKTYIKRWVKEFETPLYPKEIVNHKDARERALKTYKDAIS